MTTSKPLVHRSAATDHSACRGRAVRLGSAEAEARLRAVPGWELREGRLTRTFHCASFCESIAFVQAIAEVAERMNHHPNLGVEGKRQVRVVLWTHKLDALTTLDFDLAACIAVAHRDVSGASS